MMQPALPFRAADTRVSSCRALCTDTRLLFSPRSSALSPPARVPMLCRAARSSGAGWCRHLRQGPLPLPLPVPSSTQPGAARSHPPRQARTRAREAGSMPTDARRRQPGSTGTFQRSPPFYRGNPGGSQGSLPPCARLCGRCSGSGASISPHRPPLATAAAEISAAEGQQAAAGPGSGSSAGLPLPPTARSGTQRDHYSDRRAERRPAPTGRGPLQPGSGRGCPVRKSGVFTNGD